MATLEQVEKLREKANVSYDEARAALDASNGDILDALILLERQGKVRRPEGGGQYSGGQSAQDAKTGADPYAGASGGTSGGTSDGAGESFSDLMRRFGRFCVKVFHKGNANRFEVLKGTESKACVPINVLVLMLIFAFWVTLPLMVVGLFFGLRYRFIGPDIGSGATVNRGMDGAARAAEDIKNSINNPNNTNTQ